jgi:methionyl-tRNA formyltransferase
MRILILTQEEYLYLPAVFARVCRQLREEVVGIVSMPAMSTHGGPVKGFMRHLSLFGLSGTTRLVARVLNARLHAWWEPKPEPEGPFYSIENVARAFNLPFYQVAKAKSAEFDRVLEETKADLLISISCPQIIGRKIRERFSLGCINVHGAPLPKYRGLMPAFWVLRNGEEKTAVTVHDLAAKLDDGQILVQREVTIAPEDSWDSLVKKTKREGADALLEAIEQIRQGTVQRRPNPEEESTYFTFPAAEDRKAFLARGRSFF